MVVNKNNILSAIIVILTIVGAIWAMGDRFIAKATFTEFKQHIIYRLDNIDTKDELLTELKHTKWLLENRNYGDAEFMLHHLMKMVATRFPKD